MGPPPALPTLAALHALLACPKPLREALAIASTASHDTPQLLRPPTQAVQYRVDALDDPDSINTIMAQEVCRGGGLPQAGRGACPSNFQRGCSFLTRLLAHHLPAPQAAAIAFGIGAPVYAFSGHCAGLTPAFGLDSIPTATCPLAGNLLGDVSDPGLVPAW